MAKINKKIKKTLNMYPVVRNQPHYPSGYDGTSTPKRRKQLAEFISEDGTFLPKSVLHADLDRGMLDFVKDRLRMTVDGKPISIVDQILTTQRWAEFSNTWSFSDKDVNPEIPFLVTVRNPAVQYGSNPSLTYTIPDRRTFHYAKVPTWDGQRKGMDLYKIPQPVPVDITYDLKIVCNRMRELNNFNKVMMQTFTSRQAYTFVKGHYIPIILNTLSDESQIGDNEKRKFYTQNYTLQLQGFLIDEEEFEITPAITRKLLVFETDTKTKKKNMEPVQPSPTPPLPFIIRIDTRSGDTLNSYTIPTNSFSYTYNYDVSWSEVGNPANSGFLTNQTGNATINFPSSGQYDISITGLFPTFYANNSGDDLKLIGIIQWGTNQWVSMSSAFNGCSNLSLYSATDSPDLSNVTNMSVMFASATQFNGDISGWGVSSVTDMAGMFYQATSFNQDIGAWNVSGVTDMSFMFYQATSFNQDLSGWCVSLIPSEPSNFDTDATAWVLPKPVWGTCP